jgi:hypothetical protein
MGRKPKLTPHQQQEARRRIAKGEKTREPCQELRRQHQHDFEARRMKAPMFYRPPTGTLPQQYLYLARMFRNAALGLPAYVNADVNWPIYALLLHACELALKAFCDQSVANGKPVDRAPNHDLKGWYAIACRYGLLLQPHIAEAIDILTELHAKHYARYPDNRRTPVPDISNLTDTVVDWLISAVAPVVQQP